MKDKRAPLLSRHKSLRNTVFIPAALVAITLFVFWPVSHCGFLNYDDDGYVTANPHVQQGLSAGGAAWAFHAFETANWHPLTWLSLMLDAQLFGNNPLGFHLTNLFLHAANAILLFLLLMYITRAQWRSAFVATLFGLHPLHVESVAWISERKDVLSGLFFMLTLLVYARFVEKTKGDAILTAAEKRKAKKFYGLALLFFALGLMSKPMLVTLPFVLLLLDFWPFRRFNSSTFQRLVVEKIPFFLLSTISCAITFVAQKQGEAVQTLATFPMSMRIENAFTSYASYLAKTFWPANLALPYPYSDHWPMAGILFAASLIIGVSIVSIFLARKFSYLFVGWFWFLGMLIPVIGLVQVGQQAMADRYTYLPLIGIFIAIAWSANEIFVRRKIPREAVVIVVILIFIGLAIQTRKQIGYWQNSETLFRRAIATTKNNAEAWEHLGTFYLRDENRMTDAQNCFQRSVDISPSKISAHINLGSVFILEGNSDEAAEQFVAVLKLSPANADANCDLGYILASHGQWDDAIAHYGEAIQADPDFAAAFHNRGLAFEAKNDWTNAILDFRTAIRLDPNRASTHKHLGIALAHENKIDEAAKEFNEALRLNPDDAETLQQLQLLQK